MLRLLIDAYSLLVLAAVVLSWIQVNEDNPVRRLVNATVEPVLARIRRVIPSLGGIDFSAWVLLIGLHFLRRLL